MVVMTGGAGAAMTIVRGWVWVCRVGLESSAATVNVKVPFDVGFPEITPEIDGINRPGGSEPTFKLQV